MAQFDVYPNRDTRTNRSRPYAVEIQSDLLASMPSTVLVPLARMDSLDRLSLPRLNPALKFNDESLVLLTQDLSAVSRRGLPGSIGNISPQREEILAAIDFLFTGF